MYIETRLLYAVAFTLLGIVLAVYVLPSKSMPDIDPLNMVEVPIKSFGKGN